MKFTQLVKEVQSLSLEELTELSKYLTASNEAIIQLKRDVDDLAFISGIPDRRPPYEEFIKRLTALGVPAGDAWERLHAAVQKLNPGQVLLPFGEFVKGANRGNEQEKPA